MDIPFNYGRIVRDTDFTDRTKETDQLLKNFQALTNTAIISPRRWGKSSLVEKASQLLRQNSKEYIFIKFNCYKCENEKEFYALYAKKILEQSASSFENLVSNTRDFASRLNPSVKVKDPEGMCELEFGLKPAGNESDEEILDLPEKIAVKKGKKLIVCIDEFQQIGEFKNSKKFQKILRSHWQEHQHTAYVLYGSKKHMMLNIFGQYNSPFYRFGDIIHLPKITNSDWVEYITKRFSQTGKAVSPEDASYLADKVENHPYYVQQLAQGSWLRTSDICNQQVIDQAFDAIINSLNLQFENMLDSLTERQRNFLSAVASDEKKLTSAGTLERYNLGSSANITIMKKALIKKDILEQEGSRPIIQDPILKYWIRTTYQNV